MALLHHFGTSCIAGRNRITYGHEDGDVYQFENDRVVELSFFLYLSCRRLVFDIFLQDAPAWPGFWASIVVLAIIPVNIGLGRGRPDATRRERAKYIFIASLD